MRVYELSGQNRISSVSGNWEGGAAASQVVLGRPIWDFISGLDTRSYLNALLFAARSSGRRVAVPYRCDTPEARRLYQLQIDPLPEQSLRLAHLPIDIIPRASRPLPPPTGAQACCGQCLRWQNGSDWTEGDHFHGLASQAVDFVVCPMCRAQAQKAVDRVLSPLRGVSESLRQNSLPC